MTLQLPVEQTSRVRGLDILRGVALFGILLANVRQMFLPWSVADFPVSLGGSTLFAWIDWGIFHALVDLKFLTLFSLMFGLGFALQRERLATRGDHFTGIYLRRVFILALFGIGHGLLLYSAEVLFCYSVAGLILLAGHRLSADALLRMGLVLVGTTLIWGYQIGSLGKIYMGITVATLLSFAVVMVFLWRRNRTAALTAWVLILAASATFMTFRFDASAGASGLAGDFREAKELLTAMGSADSSTWPAEIRVRQEGDFASLLNLHLGQYKGLLTYVLIFLLWRTLGFFMIGAGLYRSGLFTTFTQGGWKKLALYGLGAGLPLSLLATYLQGQEMTGAFDLRFPKLLHTVSALPMAAGIMGVVFVVSGTQPRHRIRSLFESTGRMALTNYIGQSVVMAALAESWGFGLYARFSGPELTLLAVAVFIMLALLSHAWLSRFRMGPLEWLWRCGTYWRWLPNSK